MADPTATSVSQGLRRHGGSEWRAAAGHPMVRAIAAGEVPGEVFRRYFGQNLTYLLGYADAIVATRAAAADPLARDVLQRFAAQIVVNEIPANEAFFARVGGDPRRLPDPDAVTVGYLGHLRDSAGADVATALAALLPCQWSYGEIATSIRGAEPADAVCADWIGLFANAGYDGLVAETTGLLDRLAGPGDDGARRHLEAVFDASVRWELAFWDMAWGAGTTAGRTAPLGVARDRHRPHAGQAGPRRGGMTATRTLVLGDPVVSLGPAGVIPDGAVIVEGTAITAVGPREALEARGPFDRVVGGSGYLVMPGFVNSHYHSECWTGPGLIGTIFELSNLYLGTGPAAVDEDILQLLATWGLVQAVRGGQTGTVDAFYGKSGMELLGAEPVLRAYEEVGLRTALAVSFRDQNIYAHEDDATFLSRVPAAVAAEVRASPLGYAWPVDRVLDTYRRLVQRWDGRDGRIRIILAPDWTPACSDDLLQLCRRTADEYDTGVTTHVLETRSELMWNLEVHGTTAVRRLADLGVLGPDVTFSHFVWATDEDIAIAVDHGVNIASNPGSNLRLSSGICRVRDIMAAGGRICFGTDGISFSDREDYFEELRLAAYLQRQPDVWSEHRLDSARLLRAAGENGARAMRFEGRVGALAPGLEADLLCVRTDRLLFPPGRYAGVDVLDVLLDRASAPDIDTVMVAGRVLMTGGRMVSVDEDRLRRRIAALTDRLYRPGADSARWLQLANQLVPPAQEIYDRWYSVPVSEPAAVYNTRTPPSLPGTT